MQVKSFCSQNNYKCLFLNNILVLLSLFLFGVAAHAQVAQVIDSRGTALVERSGQLPRLLGAGERLEERDVINVARDSWAIIEFNDQTRVTLRPNTVFRLDTYKAEAPESMLLGLVKGGFRMATGLFGKRNPRGVSIQTATATIGIRGTEFDARLCEADCEAEERAKPAPLPAVLPVARVVEMSGVVGAGRAGEQARLLVPGAMLNEGDAVAVGSNGDALLVFRDGARVALAENSRFAINRFRYSETQPGEGSAFLSLFAGNAMVSTGWLAKTSPDSFLFRTALGVIRPFGTTFSGGGCVGNFCVSGSATVNSDGASASGSASGGGASASGKASAGAGGASASGTASAGGKTASGSTGTLVLPTSRAAGAPSAQQVMNQVINGVNQVLAEVVNTATTQGQNAQQQVNNVGVAVQNQVQNTAQNASAALVTQAVNALNAAAAPIVQQMTALMTQMRNNPPQTEAAARELSALATQLSQSLSMIMTQATAATSAILQSEAYLSLEGSFQCGDLVFLSQVAATVEMAAPGLGVSEPLRAVFNQKLDEHIYKTAPGRGDSLAAVGFSREDLLAVRNAGPSVPTTIFLANEYATYGSNRREAIENALIAEALAGAVAAQQRAEQQAAAALAAAEAAKVVAEAKLAAGRKAADEKAVADKQLAAQKLAAAKAAAEAELAATKRGEIRIGGMRARVGENSCLDYGDCRILARIPAPPAQYVPAPFPNTPFSKYIFRTGDEKYEKTGSEQPSNNDSGQSSAGDIATVAVWDGSVEVVGKGRIAQGEMLAPTGELLRLASRTIPDIKIAPDLFSNNQKFVEQGLYVWVRDGAVRVTKNTESVDVEAGNAAVVTDRVRLLDVVPNFMRFDGTPRPLPSGSGSVFDAFRAGDGSILNMCSIK